jgi:hypothetical protein
VDASDGNEMRVETAKSNYFSPGISVVVVFSTAGNNDPEAMVDG